jgi:hypothetical protein
MNRKNFGDSSGIIVDVCSLHGCWFDAGELPAVLKFVEEGGLARARYSRERGKGQLPSSTAPFELWTPPPPVRSSVADDVTSAIASFGLGLLEMLSRD